VKFILLALGLSFRFFLLLILDFCPIQSQLFFEKAGIFRQILTGF
jgi:hypothetical protein